MARFVQSAPVLADPYRSDHVLRSHLDRYLGPERVAAAEPRLAALGRDVTASLRAAHADAEAHPPTLRAFDAWGARVDRIEASPGWEAQRRAAAAHAVVALPYLAEARAAFGPAARVVQHALLHVYGPESATFSCPVAMSDGAAALLSRPDVDAEVRDAWLPRLIATDPDAAITSGQWMTESQGGSDISRSTTVARHDGDGWRLTGEKWFCSAADAAMAVALARPEGAGDGSRALAPFLIPRYADDGFSPASGVTLHRLKDKLGTRAVPTAEIGLDGAYALPVGDPARGGLARMMTLVVVTRLHNAAAAAAGMRRGLDLARSYAARRTIAGGRLDANPLHRATLARLAVDAEAAYALTAYAFSLLGAVEVADSAEAAAELRLIAPLAKIATGRWAVASASEYLECFGGAGYVEETGVPRLLRDAQVLPIWEGTSNVLSTDVVRAVTRDEGVAQVVGRIDAALAVSTLGPATDALADARTRVVEALAHPTAAGARDLALRLADAVTAALLVEQAAFESARGDGHASRVAELWIANRLSRADIGDAAAEAFPVVVDRA
jgi:alkylation response protein AidB-like acyl-CoA dehydrogenase